MNCCNNSKVIESQKFSNLRVFDPHPLNMATIDL